MNSATAYTPLECLLLFQSLVAFGTGEEDFVRISDQLTNSALVQNGETYDARRLTVHALTDLYTRLLRDELKADGQDVGGDETNPKKRKLQSPTLASIQDVQEHGDKLPMVVDRLYDRYRQYMIHAIREDERRYAIIEREIAQIEAGQWDETILPRQASAASTTPQLATQSRLNGSFKAAETPGYISNSQTQPTKPTSRPDIQLPSDGLHSQDRISSPNSAERSRGTAQGNPTPPHTRTPSTGPHGPSPLQLGYHTSQNVPPNQQTFGWVPPYQPGAPQNSQPQYNQHYQAPYHQQPSTRGPSQSPLLPQPFGPVPSSPMTANSPQYGQHPIHTAQPQHRASPGSPAPHFQQSVDVSQQSHLQNGQVQHGQGLQTQMPTQGPQSQSQSPHQPPLRGNSGSPLIPQGGIGYPPHYVPPRPQSAAGNQYQQWQQGLGPPPPSSHYPSNYQQYPVPPPQPHFQPPHQPFQQSPAASQPASNNYSSPYNPGKHPQPPGVLRSQMSQPATPKNRPASNITGFGTKWTPTPTGRTPGQYDQVSRPAMEAISPVLTPARLPTKPPQFEEDALDVTTPKPKPTKRSVRRGRAASTASSVPPNSRRSQSVMSHEDELSLDEAILRQVKEEVNTPRGIDEIGDTTADESSAQPQLPPHRIQRSSTKRKRAVSSVESHPAQVLWTRNFPAISRSATDQVTAHKNGGTFALPVKERDAPGYRDVIRMPQDLKSIRASVLSGNRAASAVAATMEINPSATSVWLPISEDLIPPKSIINYSQLEKETMRMFANAIMFNPDPDRGLGKRWRALDQDNEGVLGYEIDEDSYVKDTKAMFTDVETIIENLRAAERRSEDIKDKERDSSLATRAGDEDDVDELAGDGEHFGGSMGSVPKRRRKA